MFEQIIEATQNFFNDILQMEIKECKRMPSHGFFCSKIYIFKGDIKNEVSIFMRKETLNNISEIFLFEQNPNEETLIDLTKEISNLIAGSAKVLLEEKSGHEYLLSTPEFLGTAQLPKDTKMENYKKFKTKNRCFVVGLRSL